ncbi:MAG: hypothetical protein IPP37_03170 [Saprospiraceae bacterium]|nr:hypothetical protein [Saprospiraceae bacterium]
MPWVKVVLNHNEADALNNGVRSFAFDALLMALTGPNGRFLTCPWHPEVPFMKE